MNKKELYESIMKNVSREVKNTLNESNEVFTPCYICMEFDGWGDAGALVIGKNYEQGFGTCDEDCGVLNYTKVIRKLKPFTTRESLKAAVLEELLHYDWNGSSLKEIADDNKDFLENLGVSTCEEYADLLIEKGELDWFGQGETCYIYDQHNMESFVKDKIENHNGRQDYEPIEFDNSPEQKLYNEVFDTAVINKSHGFLNDKCVFGQITDTQNGFHFLEPNRKLVDKLQQYLLKANIADPADRKALLIAYDIVKRIVDSIQ